MGGEEGEPRIRRELRRLVELRERLGHEPETPVSPPPPAVPSPTAPADPATLSRATAAARGMFEAGWSSVRCRDALRAEHTLSIVDAEACVAQARRAATWTHLGTAALSGAMLVGGPLVLLAAASTAAVSPRGTGSLLGLGCVAVAGGLIGLVAGLVNALETSNR